MRYFFVLLFLSTIFIGCSQSPVKGSRDIASEEVPNSFAFMGWTPQAHFNTSDLNIETITSIQLDCENKELLPTHPQMTTKLYHNTKVGYYDQRLLKTTDKACTLSNQVKNKSEEACQHADYLVETFISDTYQDHCGNYYRGISRVVFFKSHETMATLFSPGRIILPKQKLFGDYVIGGTYAVSKEDFLFLANLFEDDAEKIKNSVSQAQSTGFKLDSDGLFQRK